MKIRKRGHIHSFGSDCAICCVNHPKDHKECKRKTAAERKGRPAGKPKIVGTYGQKAYAIKRPEECGLTAGKKKKEATNVN